VRASARSLNGIVPGALQDTTLELHDGSGATIVSNDDWRSDQETEIIGTGAPPTDDRESAVVSTLQPGAYTGIVRGKARHWNRVGRSLRGAINVTNRAWLKLQQRLDQEIVASAFSDAVL
jgi:hypothetical protein